MSAKEGYDVIIVGAGGSGLAAGMYGARLNLKVLILGTTHGSELPIGGVITTTASVENYPGFKSISGFELAKKLEEHARDYEEVEIKSEKVDSIKKKGKEFLVKTKKGEYLGRSLIFATGTKWRTLDVPGAKEYHGRGVGYCALCDGPLYKGKVLGIVGGSDSAIIDALILAQHAKKVYIIYRGEQVRAEPTNMEKIEVAENIEIINNANVVEILGDSNKVNKVKLDRDYSGSKELVLDGLFIAIGHVALSDLAKELGVELNKKGEIIIDHKNCETNIPGIFSAGDVTDKAFKQLITGVADGCTAAHSAYEYLQKK